MTPITDAFAEQGSHEHKIRALFPGAFSWSGPYPRFAKPFFILAFTNRSGSNLLADYLRQTGRFRGFGEGLNGDEVERSLTRDPIASFPDYVARLAGPPNEPGFWGIKASWDQILMLQRANIPAMFTGVRIIHSVREDILGQAVSHWIAHQTNQWTSAHKETGVTPSFAGDRIEHILMNIVRSNCYIDLIARTLDIPRHIVVYERLQDRPADEIARLAEAMSVDLGDWKPGTPRISRQRDTINDIFGSSCLEAWRSRLLS
jgi:trehalose 2-sulfotransferase